MKKIYSVIDSLCKYAIDNELIIERDYIYCRNRLLELLGLREYVASDCQEFDFKTIKLELINYAREKQLITANGISFEDDFIARVMNVFLSKPSIIEADFYENYKISAKKATDEFYRLSKATDYIKTERVSKNIVWQHQSEYGTIDMTINLSKPEKTPEEIALAQTMPASSYPKCVLCRETEGLSGENRAPRQNHRIISLELDERSHFLQYSPYSYFNEHLIILAAEHKPMHLTIDSFRAMLDFVDKFSHYFLATNTDLPLVGGSILSHEHYQGGDYLFPLDKAKVMSEISFKGINVEFLNWPMASIRVKSNSKSDITAFIKILMQEWNTYNNEDLAIIAKSEDTRHNSLNFVLRKTNNQYSAIVVFRNNRCDGANPKGIFTAKDEYRSIKNENIGIIEVMGLAILPSRLNQEIEDMKAYLLGEELAEQALKHQQFLQSIKADYKTELNVEAYVKEKMADVFVKILENCSVFKADEKGQSALVDFVEKIGNLYENN